MMIVAFNRETMAAVAVVWQLLLLSYHLVEGQPTTSNGDESPIQIPDIIHKIEDAKRIGPHKVPGFHTLHRVLAEKLAQDDKYSEIHENTKSKRGDQNNFHLYNDRNLVESDANDNKANLTGLADIESSHSKSSQGVDNKLSERFSDVNNSVNGIRVRDLDLTSYNWEKNITSIQPLEENIFSKEIEPILSKVNSYDTTYPYINDGRHSQDQLRSPNENFHLGKDKNLVESDTNDLWAGANFNEYVDDVSTNFNYGLGDPRVVEEIGGTPDEGSNAARLLDNIDLVPDPDTVFRNYNTLLHLNFGGEDSKINTNADFSEMPDYEKTGSSSAVTSDFAISKNLRYQKARLQSHPKYLPIPSLDQGLAFPRTLDVDHGHTNAVFSSDRAAVNNKPGKESFSYDSTSLNPQDSTFSEEKHEGKLSLDILPEIIYKDSKVFHPAYPLQQYPAYPAFEQPTVTFSKDYNTDSDDTIGRLLRKIVGVEKITANLLQINI